MLAMMHGCWGRCRVVEPRPNCEDGAHVLKLGLGMMHEVRDRAGVLGILKY